MTDVPVPTDATDTPEPPIDPMTRRERRVHALQAQLAQREVDAAVVTARSDIRWLTGFAGSAGSVWVPVEGDAVLITDNRYGERAAEETGDMPIEIDRTWGWLAERGAGRIALQADHLAWATARTLEELLDGASLVPETGLLVPLRTRKDAEEEALLRAACAITSEALAALTQWLEPGRTELEIARWLSDTMRDAGAEGDAFPAIVASGPNGSRPHHSPTDRAVRSGDLVTVDFGAKVGGYHADLTRTLAVGEPDPQLREIHDLVRVAQQAGVEAAVAGTDLVTVDAACRTVITDGGWGEQFTHGTGHGVGLDIHEPPFVGPTAAGTLHGRTTVTVEPGVYVPGLGGVRIEDVVLVGETSAERLTTPPHELLIL